MNADLEAMFLRYQDLQKKYDTGAQMYSELLINSVNEVRRLEARISALEKVVEAARRYIATNKQEDFSVVWHALKALDACSPKER